MLRFFFTTGQRALGPVYAQLAATDDHAYVLVEEAKAPPKSDGRTSAGSAREGLPHSPLVDAQAYLRSVDDLHEPYIHTVGEARMTLDRRTQPFHRSGVDRSDPQHCVGVAHRHGADLDGLPADVQPIARGRARCIEGKSAGIEARNAHVYGDPVSSVDLCADQSGRAIQGECVAVD